MSVRNFSSTAAETTLSSGVDGSTTTLQVSATTGFPTVPFILAIDAGAAAQELVLVTNVAGTTLTVTRAYDSTVASAHSTGAAVVHSHGAIDFREANSHVNATSGVHGATGSVVGTSGAQTLTNKTLALGSNTVSGTKAQFNAALTDGDFATLDGTETLTNKTISGSSAAGTLGVSVTGEATPRLRGGGIVHVVLDLTAPAGGAAADYTLATLPVGYRPVAPIHCVVVNPATNAAVLVRITTAGLVQNVTALGASARVLGTAVFPNA